MAKRDGIGDEDDDDSDNLDDEEDMSIVELRKEVDELRAYVEQLRRSIPIRKGLQEFDEPRMRMGAKDRAETLLKSREMRAKMTSVTAPNPAEWAKELLQ